MIDKLNLTGDDLALIDLDGGACTRAQLGESIKKTAEWILRYEDALGGKILTLLPDHPSTLAFQLAASSSISVVVVNPASSIAEILQLLRETDATSVVTNSPSNDVKRLTDQLGLGHIELIPTSRKHLADFSLELHSRSKKINDSDLEAQLILTTSGSSGKPKIVPLKNSQIHASALSIIKTLELSKDDVNVHMLPMFHIGAILDLFIVPLMSGGKVCLAHPIATENLVKAMREVKPTWIQAVPTMLKALIRSCTNEQLSELGTSLRFIRSVSAGLATGVQTEIETKMNTPVIQMYGMTETAGQICSNGLSVNSQKPGTVGRPLGCEVRILDQNGSIVPLGKNGEVCVSGTNVFSGYGNSKQSKSFHGRWFRTGDIGYFDNDNFLYLVGRTGDLINRGGEKLSSVEVEHALLEHPAISQAAVFSIPHDTLGEDVGAIIAFAPDMKARENEESIRHFLSECISNYKVPRHIHVVESLPLLASGKIDKKTCKERFLNNEPLSIANKPRDFIGAEIAEVWAGVLNQPQPMDNDDFFDAGGDSLAAHTFVLNLEERLHVTLPTNILFESPTFSELENSVKKLVKTNSRNHEEDQVLRAVRAVTAAWPGTRADEKSLIVGLGNVGEKKPLFFCANGLQDYLHLAQEMDSERPFYAMRNLNLLPEKTSSNNLKLATRYADEIDQLQPEGSLTLGGHCGGVDIARMVAEIMLNRGRDVDLIVVIDSVLREPCPAPALVIWTDNSDYSHYSGAAQFVEPERGAAHLFPFGGVFKFITENHAGLMEGNGVINIASMIEAELAREKEPPKNVNSIVSRARKTIEERKQLYRAVLSIHGPRFFEPDGHVEVEVTVTNKNLIPLMPTDESGILLIAKWKRPNGKMYLDPAGHIELNEILEPGATVKLRMRVKCRRHRVPLRLFVDLVDDGVSWFSWSGNSAAEHWMMPRFF